MASRPTSSSEYSTTTWKTQRSTGLGDAAEGDRTAGLGLQAQGGEGQGMGHRDVALVADRAHRADVREARAQPVLEAGQGADGALAPSGAPPPRSRYGGSTGWDRAGLEYGRLP
jgi:hypothetical protein